MTNDSHHHANDDDNNERRNDECDDSCDESCEEIDREGLSRMYQIALVDFRLYRAGLLWPMVAAVVDAAFVLGDPVRASEPGGNPNTHLVYEEVTVSVWHDIIAAMFSSLEDDHRCMRISEQQVREIVGEALVAEFDKSNVENDAYVNEVQFAEIIGQEFGVTIPVGTPVSRSTTASATAPRIDWERVDHMVRLIHGRVREFPWGDDEPF